MGAITSEYDAAKDGHVTVDYRGYFGGNGYLDYEKITHVIGSDGKVRPAYVYQDATGYPLKHNVSSNTRALEAAYDRDHSKSRAELAREAAGTKRYGRSAPVTRAGMAAQAVGRADWAEVDMRAEAEQKGVSVQELEDWLENPAKAEADRLDRVKRDIGGMSYDDKIRVYNALVDSGFNPNADNRL